MSKLPKITKDTFLLTGDVMHMAAKSKDELMTQMTAMASENPILLNMIGDLIAKEEYKYAIGMIYMYQLLNAQNALDNTKF